MVLLKSGYLMFAALLVASLSLPGVAHSQAIGMKRVDTTPPVITHTPQSDYMEGMPIRIQAVVSDNVGVAEVTLFYRKVGSRHFVRLTMDDAPGKDVYTADLPLMAGAVIEYFIQASDQAGNIAPEQLIEPYVINMPPVAVAQTAGGASPDIRTSTQGQGDKKTGINKWVWIGIGAAVVGAAVIAGGNGGGGGVSNGVPVEGTGTGTVTITGPVP